ncbi:carbohydrate ABC transporter permease [Treponema lecithinolyticum]|jgi:sugar transport system (permease) (binding protein dependent transporter)|uniref:carbohydrate ABC transporter permease n=1 Tax=Treponema lecithinolyticum TaxID=53418 RepID=UPI0028EDD9D4|nr:carbohydrate ABC transporter permease [Treponema lecithinolyticum]
MRIENKKHDFLKISYVSNKLLHIVFTFISLLMILPIVFVIIISFTSQASITKYGYSFFPKELSLEAYRYVFNNTANMGNSFFVSIFVTVTGTALGTLIMSMYAYVLSRKQYAYRKFFHMTALIPMLFSGGMVTTYLVMTTFLGLKNNLLALILPLAMSPFYIFILKTFLKNSVPESLIESVKVDGASEIQTFFYIVVPIAKPGIATIALFLTLGYWNDWFNAMLYIEDPAKIPLQYLLIRMDNTTNFLKQMGSLMGASILEISASIPADPMKMAIVVLIVLPIALAYPYFQRYFVRGLTIGSVKE